jgi:sigma-E factor negative regulatory protein RseA
MKEALSGLIDGDVRGDDVQLHLNRLRGNVELRHAWDTYHLIGDALRGDISPNLCARVAARLRTEPTVLAPQRRVSALRHAAWYGLSAAAGVAAVALVVWTAFPGLRPVPQLASNPAATIEAANPVAGGVTAVAVGAAPAAEASPRLSAAEVQDYLFAHQSYSRSSALQGVAPYARTVSDEREIGKR